MKNVDFKMAFHKAYLRQQGEELNERTVLEYSIDPDRLVLLEKTDRYWIIKTLADDHAGEILGVVYKDDFDMHSIEIR